jgi:hypothetical protein
MRKRSEKMTDQKGFKKRTRISGRGLVERRGLMTQTT